MGSSLVPIALFCGRTPSDDITVANNLRCYTTHPLTSSLLPFKGTARLAALDD